MPKACSTRKRRFELVAGAGRTLDRSGVDDRSLGLLDLQAVPFQLTANLRQKPIEYSRTHQAIAQPALGDLAGNGLGQFEPRKQHEIEPGPQVFLKFGIAQAMPLAERQALEQHQRFIALRASPPRFSPPGNNRSMAGQSKSASTLRNMLSLPMRRALSKPDTSINDVPIRCQISSSDRPDRESRCYAEVFPFVFAEQIVKEAPIIRMSCAKYHRYRPNHLPD